MKVNSNVCPEPREYLQGKILANFNVKENVDDEGVVSYSYDQLRFDTYFQEEVIEKEIAKALIEIKKQERDYAIDNVIVTTTAGNKFNGEDKSQGRMASAILAADVLGKTEEEWKMADDTIKLIHIDELKEALALSILEVGRLIKGE
jgi:hypothetical protein